MRSERRRYIEEWCGTIKLDDLTFMTQTNRLALNTVVSYSRSLLALFLGLFSARWVLQALGQDDYGLYGVVGSLLVSISFLNMSLSGSVSRFYAFSIGAARTMIKDAAERDLRGWFNAALVIHCGLALLLVSIGLPIGEYVIRHILSIPADRIEACAWVLRFSIFSSVMGILAVPYCAFYTAYQFIAELTVFEMIRTVLNFLGAGVLLHVSSDRLVIYSLMMALISVMISIAQLWRAQYQFPLRMSLRHFTMEFMRVKELFRFGMLKLMGILGWIFKVHGSAFVINLNFPLQENAAYSIANQVVVHSTALATALVNAIAPALTTFSGAGDFDKTRSYAIRTCKMSGFLVLLFAVPLICEMDYVLKLWLKTPPSHAAELCSLFLLAFLIDTMSIGCMTAINTVTRIAAWQFSESFILIACVPVLWVCYRSGCAFLTMGHVFIVVSVLIVCERLYFGKNIVGISPLKWGQKVLGPVTIAFMCSYFLGCIVRDAMPTTIYQLISVSGISFVSTAMLFWVCAIDSTEKKLLLKVIDKFKVKRG